MFRPAWRRMAKAEKPQTLAERSESLRNEDIALFCPGFPREPEGYCDTVCKENEQT